MAHDKPTPGSANSSSDHEAAAHNDSQGSEVAHPGRSALDAKADGVTAPHQRRYKRKPKPTPLPMDQMVPMTFVLLNESLTGTMLTPFVAYLVAHIQGSSVDEAGYTAGTLVGAFALGQVASAKMWGWLSDVYGRRFPLISGLFVSGIMILGFGLSSSIWMCVLFRFLHGLFNGNVLVAKTMMADITNKSNEAKGFAFVSLCFGIGTLIGPAIGGYLYDPPNAWVLQWAHFSEDGFNAKYPAFLPCFIMFLYTTVGMVACTFFVKESNPKAKPLPSYLKLICPCFLREAEVYTRPPLDEGEFYTEDDEPAPSGDRDDEDLVSIASNLRELEDTLDPSFPVGCLGIGQPLIAMEDVREFDAAVDELRNASFRSNRSNTASVASRTRAAEESGNCRRGPREDPLSGGGDERRDEVKRSSAADGLPSSSSGSQQDHSSLPGETIVVEVTHDGLAAAEQEPAKFGYKQAFAIPVTRFVLILYMVITTADMAFMQIIPLWMSASRSSGGLGFLPQQSSMVLLCNSVPCIGANLVFHKICQRYHNKMGLFRMAVLVTGVLVAVLPLTSYLLPECLSTTAASECGVSPLVILLVLVCTCGRQFFMAWAYGLVTMLTARSAPPGHVGSIMGINQSCGAVMRAVTPFVVAPLFAWSITSGYAFPLDHVLVFFLASVTFLYSWGSAYGIRTDDNNKLEMESDGVGIIDRVKNMCRS